MNRLNGETQFIIFVCFMNFISMIMIRDTTSIIRFAVTLYCMLLTLYNNLVGFKSKVIKRILYIILLLILLAFLYYVFILDKICLRTL